MSEIVKRALEALRHAGIGVGEDSEHAGPVAAVTGKPGCPGPPRCSNQCVSVGLLGGTERWLHSPFDEAQRAWIEKQRHYEPRHHGISEWIQ